MGNQLYQESLQEADTQQEMMATRVDKALEAHKAVEEHGSNAKAADALGVSSQTIKNRLKHLPEVPAAAKT